MICAEVTFFVFGYGYGKTLSLGAMEDLGLTDSGFRNSVLPSVPQGRLSFLPYLFLVVSFAHLDNKPVIGITLLPCCELCSYG